MNESNTQDIIRPFPGVLIHPGNFSRVTVEACGISTRILAAQFEANDRNAFTVARWMGCSVEHVMTAVAYEASERKKRGLWQRLFGR
jgi:hypothetical protein